MVNASMVQKKSATWECQHKSEILGYYQAPLHAQIIYRLITKDAEYNH